MKKLPAWSYRFVMPLILTGLMTAIVSGISTFRIAGVAGLGTHWLSAWLWSWAVAYPVILFVMPIVNWLVARIVEPKSEM